MLRTHGIFLIDNKNKILLVHATNGNWKNWSVPKGLGETGETSLASAKRELKEETNIDLDTLLGVHTYEYVYLGSQRYKHIKKTVEGHLYKINSNLSERDLDLKCTSLIWDEITPECDKFVWKPLEVGLKWMHESQTELLKRYLNN